MISELPSEIESPTKPLLDAPNIETVFIVGAPTPTAIAELPAQTRLDAPGRKTDFVVSAPSQAALSVDFRKEIPHKPKAIARPGKIIPTAAVILSVALLADACASPPNLTPEPTHVSPPPTSVLLYQRTETPTPLSRPQIQIDPDLFPVLYKKLSGDPDFKPENFLREAEDYYLAQKLNKPVSALRRQIGNEGASKTLFKVWGPPSVDGEAYMIVLPDGRHALYVDPPGVVVALPHGAHLDNEDLKQVSIDMGDKNNMYQPMYVMDPKTPVSGLGFVITRSINGSEYDIAAKNFPTEHLDQLMELIKECSQNSICQFDMTEYVDAASKKIVSIIQQTDYLGRTQSFQLTDNGIIIPITVQK
ncbi:hypothetical protein M1271_04760 [Patescibacteria group bacterium]|nr:hypothetical protein [Patescibacteria group bacterium]MCL5798230.1 hypothetical protein [Patescibacteria group bacterium]